jgi:UDP-glucuronate 4-epimerase
MNILVTGGAGFIGSTLIDNLLKDVNNYVISIDNYDEFYDKEIKVSNQANHFKSNNFKFYNIDIRDIQKLNIKEKIDCIVHLAAKAGVRPSVQNPKHFYEVNVNGTLSMLEYAKNNNIQQFVFASSSSVYGINNQIPWKEDELNLLPISPYASSKIACEKLGFTYSHIYNIRFIGLRFFTVYGPRQRPDLAINKFFKNILSNKPIDVFGDGNTYRDYTYIDDIILGIKSAMYYDKSNYELINLGNSKTVKLIDLIDDISKLVNIPKIINFKSEQIGDVPKTCADIQKAFLYLDFNPITTLSDGLKNQLNWIKSNCYD